MDEKYRIAACLVLSFSLHLGLMLLDGFRFGIDGFPQAADGKGRLVVSLVETIAFPLIGDSERSLTGSRGVGLADDKERRSEAASETPSRIIAEKNSDPVVPRAIDDYLPPSRLDKVPTPLGNVEINVDFKAMRGLVGEAEIMLLISSAGEIDEVLVTESTLPDFLVAEAVGYFKGLRFDPGMVSQTNVRSRIRIRLMPPSDDELLANPYSAKEKAWKR